MGRSRRLGRVGIRLLAGAALAASGCGERQRDLPAPSPPATPWLAGLEERAVSAVSGETVWAVVPRPGSGAAAVGSYRLASADGTRAVLEDDLGNRYEGVPGALVHPLSGFPEAGPSLGAPVLADRWDARQVVGRVAELAGGEVRLAFDWNGVTVTRPMPVVMALPAGGDRLVLRWVAYRPSAEDAWQRGLCFAESADRVWVSGDGGFVAVVAKDGVRRLDDLGRVELRPGDPVAAHSWGHGFRPGVIAEVLEPGLRYAVALDDGPTRAFFFDRLSAALRDPAL